MEQIPVVSLPGEARQLLESARPVSVLWQDPGALAFIARGREYRNEFHIDPSDEIIYVLKGNVRVHYRTPGGKEEVAMMPEGSMIHIPAGVPHSPRGPSDAVALVIERPRREGEIDLFIEAWLRWKLSEGQEKE